MLYIVIFIHIIILFRYSDSKEREITKIIKQGSLYQNIKSLYQMKPTPTPYDRNSRLGLKMITVNPCNQFIIQTLLRWKVKVQKQGLNQFYTYNLAIQSVRKYPLPLLCYQQMKVLQGFGKFFCTAVTKMIRNHYQRGRLPTKQQKQEQDREHEQYLRRQMKKLKNLQNKGQNIPKQQGLEQENQEEGQYSEFNDNFESQFATGDDQQSQCNNQQSNFSDTSSVGSSKVSKNYKPKPGCQTYYVLKAMSTFLSTRPNLQVVSKGQINELLYEWKMDKVRTWNKIVQQLKQSGYLKVDPKDDYYLMLTTKGKDYVAQTAGQQQTFKNNNSNNQNMVIKIFRKQELTQSSQCPNLQKLFILVNKRGSFKSQEQFISKLSEQPRYKIKQLDFQLASYIWQLDQKILDYIVFRFKMQNFDIQQYNTTIERAKNSQCSNIYVIFQYPFTAQRQKSKKLSIPQQTIAELIANTRAAGMKLVKLYGIDSSVKFVQNMTDRIMQKIKHVNKSSNLAALNNPQSNAKAQQILMLGTLQFYNQKNKKLLPGVHKQVSKKFLKCIPRINRNSVQGFIQKFPAFRIAYDQMLRLANNQQRINFLNWMLSKCQQRAGVNMLIIDLLYLDSYQLQP